MSTARSSREPFSNVDAAWLHMDSPTNLAVITGVLILDKPLDFERLQAVLITRLLCFKRFRQRVHHSRLKGPSWELDPHFDLDYHLTRMDLPAPGDQAALEQFTGELMATPLDRSRPLWRYYYIEKFGDGAALVVRLHHCIADGLALMQVLLSMADEDPDAPLDLPDEKQSTPLSPLARILRPAVSVVRQVRGTVRQTENLLHEGMDILVHPSRLVNTALFGASTALSMAKLALLSPDPKTIFRGRCGFEKKTVWSQPVSLEDVKGIARLMGGTVNDVLLSAVTGALRRYLEEHEQPVSGLNIRAVVPLSLRKPEETNQLGNRFGLVFLTLPLGVRDPIKRLIVLKRRMDVIKHSTEAVAAIGILNAIGMSPTQIENVVINIFGKKGTAVMTNVPGPRQRLYLAGSAIRRIMFWVPAPSNLGMGVSIMSYAGEVVLGVMTDACLIKDPERIVAAFQEEFQYLKKWGRPPEAVETPVETSPQSPEPESIAAPEPGLQEPKKKASTELLEVETIPQLVGAEVKVSPNGRCQALTKTGRPCRNRALPGLATCRVHTLEISGLSGPA